jgi:hypothetical protein
MKVLLGLVLLGHLVVATIAGAQAIPPAHDGAWRVSLTIGTSTFSGAATSTDESTGNLVFRPYRPTMLGVGLTYGRERARFGLFAKYGQPGLGFRGVPGGGEASAAGLLIVVENAFHLASITASAGTRVARLRGGPVLRSSLGLTVEHWSAPGTPVRALMGPQAGLALEFTLTGSLFANIDGELGFTPGSPFQVEDLPDGFRLRSTWRRTLQAGLSLKL